MSEISELLERINAGDPAARDSLFAVLYQDLRKLARARLRHSETITLLDTTSLVHESYLRLLNAHELEFTDRGGYLVGVERDRPLFGSGGRSSLEPESYPPFSYSSPCGRR